MRVLYIGIMLEEADHSQVVRDSLRGVCASLRGLIFPLYYAIMDPPESEIGGLYGFACVIWFVTFIVVFMSAPAYCFFTVIPVYILQVCLADAIWNGCNGGEHFGPGQALCQWAWVSLER